MAPALFSRVTRAQAVAAFGADAPAETYCDGNFVKLDGAVLVFATLAGEGGTRLAYADRIDWRKPNADRDKGWLPSAVCDPFDAERKRVFEHFLLIRRPSDDERWLYCGRAHLGGYGIDRDGVGEANFTLTEGSISSNDWRSLDGWRGWQVQICGELRDFTSEGSAGFAVWLAEFAEVDLIDIFMTAPTSETFTFFVNASRAAVFYMPTLAEGWTLSLRDPNETSDVEETFFENLGPAEFTHERFRTIPRAAALRASILAFHGLLAPQSGLEIDCDGFRARWSDW